MNCPKCNSSNGATAQFCTNCGTTLQPPHDKRHTSPKTTDLFIMIFLSYFVGSEIIRQLIMLVFNNNWHEGTTKYIIIGLNLISGLSILLLGFSIQRKNMKIFGLIIASIWAIYIFYNNFTWMLK